MVVDFLESNKHDKWGFVIYRCTYEDDHGWDRFKQIIYERTQREMQESDTPEAADSLEWTFVEDRTTLDGASRAKLRDRFNQWAAQAIVTKQPRAQAETQIEPTFGIPRYNYFIQVDEEALKSVLAAPDDLYGEGYVNFVDSQWRPLAGRSFHGKPYDSIEDEVFDEIDGCTEENVGYMRIASGMIDAAWYDTVVDFPGGGWYLYYKRPPEIVLY